MPVKEREREGGRERERGGGGECVYKGRERKGGRGQSGETV